MSGLSTCLLLLAGSTNGAGAHLPGQEDFLQVPLAVFQCADNDGGRLTPVDSHEVRRMVDIANSIYSRAKIKLLFSDADFKRLDNTKINSLMGNHSSAAQRAPGTGKSTEEEFREIFMVQDQVPGKLLIFFRYGDNPNSPTGGAFSSSDQACVVMASPRHTNGGLRALAHEVGHFFGLSHTFGPQLGTVEAVSRFLADNNNDLSKLDGDGLSDTAPDPGIDGVTGSSVKGLSFAVPFGNVMSYMGDYPNLWISDQQAAIAHDFCAMRMRFGMCLPTNQPPPSFEAESLRYELSPSGWATRQDMSGYGKARWSSDEQLAVGGPVGTSVQFKFTVSNERDCSLAVYLTLWKTYGIVKFAVDGETVAKPFDCWAISVIPSGPVPLGRFHFSKGVHVLQITSIGKNPASSDYSFGIDCFRIVD